MKQPAFSISPTLPNDPAQLDNPRPLPGFSPRRVRLLLVAMLSGAAALGTLSCKKDKPSAAPLQENERPTLRIYALGGAAGAIEPCGCVKDMLGGVDHAAAYIESQKSKVDSALVVGAGPMFFESPVIEAKKKDQELEKARAMAQSLSDLNLVAWAPGANDWADGEQGFSKLCKETGAHALGANLTDPQKVVTGSYVTERGELSIGLVGISMPRAPTAQVPVQSNDALSTLNEQLEHLSSTDLRIALIAAPRGEALRLVERVNRDGPMIQVAILGKPYDQGESNDAPISPEVIEGALVVQAPNHLQALSVIDLYVREGTSAFKDGTGLSAHERRVSLQGRIDELERRIERWKAPASRVDPKDVARQEQALAKLRAELSHVQPGHVPEKGSYFLYDLVFVKESLGQDPAVAARLNAYYQRVNEHNRVVFADRLPQPAAEGQPSYVGVDACSGCHSEERAFWDRTGHAGAYETLQESHKEFNLDCVSCHVTGYERPGGSTVTHVDGLTDVQCEVCHGPGSLHAKNPLQKGSIQPMPARSLCASSCHHAPHVGADWSVDVAWPQIIGPGHGM